MASPALYEISERIVQSTAAKRFIAKYENGQFLRQSTWPKLDEAMQRRLAKTQRALNMHAATLQAFNKDELTSSSTNTEQGVSELLDVSVKFLKNELQARNSIDNSNAGYYACKLYEVGILDDMELFEQNNHPDPEFIQSAIQQFFSKYPASEATDTVEYTPPQMTM